MARTADRLGYDFLRFGEHLVIHKDMVPAMGSRWNHALTAATFAAAVTTRIRMLPLLVVPYRHPVELARALATLYVLSGGRVSLIAAVGYMDWEFELLNQPFASRYAIADEYLRAMIELWTADEPEFDGRFVRFRDIVFDPKPVQKPRIPILLGGYADSALRRVARYGDGWMPQRTVTRAEPSGSCSAGTSKSTNMRVRLASARPQDD